MTDLNAAVERLRSVCYRQLARYYTPDVSEHVAARLDYELSLIERNEHATAFRMAAELRQHAAEHESYCRLIGAGSCSLVSYLLDLSNIDPLRYHLPAERLLSNQPIRLVFHLDPRHEVRIRRYRDDRFEFERSLHVHPANRLALIVHRTEKLIREKHDPTFDLRSLSAVEESTGATLAEMAFDDLVELEADEIQYLIQKVKPYRLETVAAVLAAYEVDESRDGILEEFLGRSAPTCSSGCLEALLADVMEETHGLLLYQEQIMLSLSRLGNISLAEGHEFVKLAAKQRSVEAFRERLLTSASYQGLSPDEAGGLFAELSLSARHAVCKAHHLANALTIWQAAHLKLHFLSEFSLAIAQSELGNS